MQGFKSDGLCFIKNAFMWTKKLLTMKIVFKKQKKTPGERLINKFKSSARFTRI